MFGLSVGEQGGDFDTVDRNRLISQPVIFRPLRLALLIDTPDKLTSSNFAPDRLTFSTTTPGIIPSVKTARDRFICANDTPERLTFWNDRTAQIAALAVTGSVRSLMSIIPPPGLREPAFIGGDAGFHLGAEILDQALDRPGGGVTQSADRMALDLLGHLLQHIYLFDLRPALTMRFITRIIQPCPRGTACTGRSFHACRNAPAGDRGDHVGGFVHDDDRGRAQTGLDVAQTVEIHQHRVADRFRQQRHARPAGDDRQQVVPAAAHAAAILIDQLAQGDAKLLLHIAGLVHMAEMQNTFVPAFFGRPRR